MQYKVGEDAPCGEKRHVLSHGEVGVDLKGIMDRMRRTVDGRRESTHCGPGQASGYHGDARGQDRRQTSTCQMVKEHALTTVKSRADTPGSNARGSRMVE